MKTITYTNNQGLELKINKFSSGQFKWAFSLTFNNGAHTFCYTMTELRTILLKNGMTRKWAANVKDRFDPLTEEHVLINRYRIPGGIRDGGLHPQPNPVRKYDRNRVGHGLHETPSSWSINSTTTGSNSFNSRDPKIGVPTFFSFFNQKIFHFKKLFLYL